VKWITHLPGHTHPQDKELYHMVLKAMVCTPDVQEAALKDNPVVKVRHG
jgi:hypothetical protein